MSVSLRMWRQQSGNYIGISVFAEANSAYDVLG